MSGSKTPWRQWFRRVRRGVKRCAEAIIWGGRTRERLLLALLSGHYRSRMRRDWKLADELPHFVDHRAGSFRLMLGDGGQGPYPYARAFHTAEALRVGDRLLDIGCGDGFFDRRFFATRCAHIDALDIDRRAIETARQLNRAENIEYHLRDAVNHPFPGDEYDVVVWDGALGHFSFEESQRVFAKIGAALSTDGIFVGSEILGDADHDHLQTFMTLEDLAAVLQPLFHHVMLRSATYEIAGNAVRTEAYWRCGKRRERLDAAGWVDYSRAASRLPLVG